MPQTDTPTHTPSQKAETFLAFLLLSTIPGFVAGIGTFAALWAVDKLRDTVWDAAAEQLPGVLSALSPLILCLAGGLVVGLWTRHCGFKLDTMHQVFALCKKEGGYHIPHLGRTLGLFFAPIVFGGAIGPEAGIAGFAAAGFTAVLDKTRIGGTGALSADTHPFRRAIRTLLDTDDEASASKEAKESLQELPLRKFWKVLLWILAAIFFVLGWASISRVLGSAGEMPRFDGIDYATANWGAGIVALALGYVFALFALASQKVAEAISSAIGPDPLKKTLLAGLVLGASACILPDLTFSGQDDIVDLIGTWQSWTPALLILVAFVKIFMTKMCVACDWTGGEFFPTIFCGVALGYAVALLMGADPLLPVALAAGAAVGGWTRKPILATAVLALCFPPITLPAVLAASWIAAKLPHPQRKAV
jgi:hypothetical protein